jgi:large subunit ribosomal protein L15
MPLQRRVPKVGFKNPNRVEYVSVNLDVLQGLVEQHSKLQQLILIHFENNMV